MPRGRPIGASHKRGPHEATISPTIRDLEWAAGFLEGEGSFYGQEGKGGSQNVSANQVNSEPLARLLMMFGGRLMSRPRTTETSNDYWAWSATGPRARGIMLTLFLLLSKKRQDQITKALTCG